MGKCPTCGQPTDRDAEAIIQARIATRPMAGPAQARHIARLEAQLQQAQESLKSELTERAEVYDNHIIACKAERDAAIGRGTEACEWVRLLALVNSDLGNSLNECGEELEAAEALVARLKEAAIRRVVRSAKPRLWCCGLCGDWWADGEAPCHTNTCVLYLAPAEALGRQAR